MNVVNNLTLEHGVAVIARRQTNAVGRSSNQVGGCKSLQVKKKRIEIYVKIFVAIQWLSPDGCAVFTLQLHIPLSSALGQRLPLLQHLVSIATVLAVTNIPGYQVTFIAFYNSILEGSAIPASNFFGNRNF